MADQFPDLFKGWMRDTKDSLTQLQRDVQEIGAKQRVIDSKITEISTIVLGNGDAQKSHFVRLPTTEKSLVDIHTHVEKLSSSILYLREQLASLPEVDTAVIADHESRLRTIEKMSWKAMGLVIGVSFLMSLLMPSLSKIIVGPGDAPHKSQQPHLNPDK